MAVPLKRTYCLWESSWGVWQSGRGGFLSPATESLTALLPPPGQGDSSSGPIAAFHGIYAALLAHCQQRREPSQTPGRRRPVVDHTYTLLIITCPKTGGQADMSSPRELYREGYDQWVACSPANSLLKDMRKITAF